MYFRKFFFVLYFILSGTSLALADSNEPVTAGEREIVAFILQKAESLGQQLRNPSLSVSQIIKDDGLEVLMPDDLNFVQKQWANKQVAHFTVDGTHLKIKTLDNSQSPTIIDVDFAYIFRGSIDVGGYWVGYEPRKSLSYNYKTYFEPALKDFKQKDKVGWQKVLLPAVGILFSMQGCTPDTENKNSNAGLTALTYARLATDCAGVVISPHAALVSAGMNVCQSAYVAMKEPNAKSACNAFAHNFVKNCQVLGPLTELMDKNPPCSHCPNSNDKGFAK